VYELLAAERLDGCFANRLSQDDYEITKPDPRYLSRIAESADVRADQCIMVGDRIDKDVIPARQNGMGTVFVRSGVYRDQAPRTPEEIPDLVLDSIHGLSAAIAARWPQESE
jgi:FMN phosphatase YigB (HAD superfamily)